MRQAALLDMLFSSKEDEAAVSTVRIKDGGSQPQCAQANIKSVLDSGTDKTITGEAPFKQVATVAWLKKHDLKKLDETTQTYDQMPFSLDGCMDLDVSFGEKTIHTPILLHQ